MFIHVYLYTLESQQRNINIILLTVLVVQSLADIVHVWKLENS